MSDGDIILAGGGKLRITVSSFADSNALLKALLKAAKGTPLGDDFLKQDLSAFKDVLIEVIASPDVERALWRCMERATYNDVKLIPANFDDPRIADAFRRDYYEAAMEVIKVNCSPFFEKALSALKARLASAAASPKSA